MGRKVPTADYPSRTDAILAMVASGASHTEVARALGITRGTVAKTIHIAQKRGEVPSRARRFTVRAYLFDNLKRAAESRDLRASSLVERLLCRIVKDDLFDAILDDD